jgi:transcription elongation factor Elf1
MYDEVLDDPKVQKLPVGDFRGWVNLLCLASRNDGKLPPAEDIAFALRETVESVSTLLERLRNAGLIECRNGGANGSFHAPRKWDERQYKSDTSTDRVKRFRQRSKSVPETPPDTETEADTEEESVSDETLPPLADNGELKVSFNQLVEAWNGIAVPRGAIECRRLSPERRNRARPFLKRYSIEDITEAIRAVARADFLCGRDPKNFRADIDFLFSATHMNRLLEGFYDR